MKPNEIENETINMQALIFEILENIYILHAVKNE